MVLLGAVSIIYVVCLCASVKSQIFDDIDKNCAMKTYRVDMWFGSYINVLCMYIRSVYVAYINESVQDAAYILLHFKQSIWSNMIAIFCCFEIRTMVGQARSRNISHIPWNRNQCRALNSWISNETFIRNSHLWQSLF